MACNLYSFTKPGGDVYQYNILDCSGNTQTLYYPATGGTNNYSFCGNDIIEFTGATPSITSGACQSNCACFTLNKVSTGKPGFTYVNCNNDFVTPIDIYLDAQPAQFVDFCALYVSADTKDWTVANNGDCETGCTFCRCIIVSNTNNLLTENFTYTDCNGNPNLVTLGPLETITFCGLDTDITFEQSTNLLAVNYGNQCVDDPGGDYPFKCPCKCTTFSNTTAAFNDNVYLLYTDCNNVVNTIQPSNDPRFESNFCVQNFVSIISALPQNRPEPGTWLATYGPDCVDNTCPCYCYTINNPNAPYTLEYVNCGTTGTTVNIVPTSVIGFPEFTFCSPSIITQSDISILSTGSVLFTGGTCSSGSCVCNCYSLTNNTGSGRKQPKYIDCNGLLQTISLENGETQKICSLGFHDVVISGLTITNEGPCIDDKCPTTPITGDCTCYYALYDGDVTITNCDGIEQTISSTKRFCALNYISGSTGMLVGKSGNLCTGGECPQNVSCYNIDAGEGLDVQTYYISTDGEVGLLLEPGPVNFCAKAILTVYDSTGNPTGFELGTVTNTGDCILVDGRYNCPAPCYCFYIFDSTYVDYTDCNYENNILSLNPGFNKICAQSISSVDGTYYNSGLLCESNRCPNYCCNCYTITNLSESEPFLGFTYLTCDLTMSEPYDIPAGESLTVCALNIPPNLTGYSITLNGPCYNGECVYEMSLEDQLLYGVLTTLGPCPQDCCGENTTLGGPMGIDITDIKSGKVL
jgi:hypothetical protein